MKVLLRPINDIRRQGGAAFKVAAILPQSFDVERDQNLSFDLSLNLEVGDILNAAKNKILSQNEIEKNILKNEELSMSLIRRDRSFKINATQWIVDRHRDEIDAGLETSLTGDQFAKLLHYRQNLRDFPKNVDLNVDNFTKIVWPKKPDFI